MSTSFFSWSSYRGLLMDILVPNEQHVSVTDIDLTLIKEKGYTTILLDVDNTVVSRHQRNLSLGHLNWIEKCKSLGFRVIILSNNRSKKRIHRICEQCQCIGYYLACKPFVYSARYALRMAGVHPKKAVVIGDQVFTDIILGRWLRAYTVLVDPIDTRLSFIKRIQFQFERFCLKVLEK